MAENSLYAKDTDSRVEKILSATLGNYDKPLPKPQSRVEEYLMAIKEQGGGGGGTKDYNALDNKPTINGTTVEGDLKSKDIGVEGDYDITYDPNDEKVKISQEAINSLLGH